VESDQIEEKFYFVTIYLFQDLQSNFYKCNSFLNRKNFHIPKVTICYVPKKNQYSFEKIEITKLGKIKCSC
jgi:hypothetical protein